MKSWRDDLTESQRAEERAISEGILHTRLGPAGAKYLRFVDGKAVWSEDPSPVRQQSMFPYNSTAMSVDPEEVPEVTEQLRRKGIFVEFDSAGCPIITSTQQQSDLAKAMGMKTGRDGYGHTDQYGRFQNSGRRRAGEVASGRAKVRGAINKLNAMPEDSPPDAVTAVLREYDIVPNEANTG